MKNLTIEELNEGILVYTKLFNTEYYKQAPPLLKYSLKTEYNQLRREIKQKLKQEGRFD